MKGATLVINGEKFSIDDVDKVLAEIKIEKAKNIKIGNDKGIVFQGHHSCFSNMSKSEFNFEGKKYYSAETAYQGKNAEENGHHDTAMRNRSLAKKDLYKAKRMAKYIKEKPEWSGKKEKVMKSISEAKFSQNEELKKKLLKTGDAKLCEGTSDQYCGCGTPIAKSKTIQMKTAFSGDHET